MDFKSIIENIASDIPLKKLTSAAEKMSERYRTESGEGKVLVAGEAETVAYAAVRMPATFGAVKSALSHTAEHFCCEIETMLDIGAGTGACCFAAEEVFCDLKEITCLEREKAMLELGKRIMSETEFPIECRWINKDITEDFNHKAELVTASYVMNELTDKKRRQLTEKLWECTEKLLVIIEPGTPVGFSNIKAIRNQLISMGGKVVAPCPHSDDCPLKEDDWCHFTARIQRSKLHKLLKGGDAPYEDEKFSYIAVIKEACEPCTARVIRHPKIESGKITLKLCEKGGISEKIITKKDGALFKKARKSDCGDNFRFS